MGSQAVLRPVPAHDLAEALSSLGIPCFLGGMSRGEIDEMRGSVYKEIS